MQAEMSTNTNRLPQSFMDAAREFEQFKIDEIKRSRTLAWRITFVSIAITVIAVIGILISFLLHKDPEPVILKVDNNTGASEILRSVIDTKEHYDDVINKYWLAMYVRTCESYDWFSISSQFEMCKLMSDASVADEYSKRIQDKDSPLTLLKDKGKISIKIVSISFIKDIAQIRFTSEKLSTSGENLDNSPVQRYIATASFVFKPSQMTEQQRLVNPLGFTVLSYRVDPEVLNDKK